MLEKNRQIKAKIVPFKRSNYWIYYHHFDQIKERHTQIMEYLKILNEKEGKNNQD